MLSIRIQFEVELVSVAFRGWRLKA